MRSRSGSITIGEHSRSTERWNDVPRGTMDEVSSFGRLGPAATTDDKAAQ